MPKHMVSPDIPWVDLHRHLDGNIRLETILDLGRQHDIPLPAWELETLRPHVQVTEPKPGVMAFLANFEWMVAVLADQAACRRVAYENVEDAWREGLDYVELRFSPVFMAEPHDLEPASVVAAVVEGIQQGRRDYPVEVNLIGIISRTYGPEKGWQELAALLTRRDHFVGLDLAGDEINFPGALFVEHCQEAREAGWQVTVHAGESCGPERVWEAIKELGASRIGHAVHAVEDRDLLAFLREQRIGIECNLTSNVQTTTVPGFASHPLRTFLEQGLLATINTDDPGISNIDLAHEYNIAAPAAGLTREQIHQAQANAVEVAFLSAKEREALKQRKQLARDEKL